MKYYLFIDESGDHGLTTVDPVFPIFLLSGVLVSEEEYQNIRAAMNELKTLLWNDKEVIFHSRDIRKCEKEFKVLFDLEVKRKFYEELDKIIARGNYTVFASAIKKDMFIEIFGKLSNDVYELALSFIIERTVFCLDGIKNGEKELEIVIEERGKKEDKKLGEHFQRLMARGTGTLTPERLNKYGLQISFKNKKENINGLQLADLVAYPTARYVLEPNRANPAFDIFQEKIHCKNEKRHGLKIFPPDHYVAP